MFNSCRFTQKTMNLEKLCRLQYPVVYVLNELARCNSFNGIDFTILFLIKAFKIVFTISISNEINSIGASILVDLGY